MKQALNGEPILPKTQVHVFHHFDIVDTPNGTYQVQLNEFFNLRLNPVLAPNGSYRNMTANEYAARFIKTLQKTITIQAKQAIDIIHQLASFYQGTYSLQFEGDKPYLKVYEKKFLAMLGVSRRQVYDIKDGTVIKIDSGNQIPRELYIWKFDAEAQKNLARVYGWGLIQDSKGTKYYIREENLLPLIIYESDAKLERLKARLAIIHQQNAPDMNQQVNKKLQEYGIRREADIHRIDELFNYMEKFHMGDIRVNQLGYRENGEIVIIDWGDAEETLLENKFGTYKLFKTLLSVDYQQYKNNLLQSGEGVLSIEEYLNMFQLQPTIITEIHPFPASPVLESQVVSEAAVASGAMKPLGLRDPLDEDRSDNSLRSKFAGIDFRFLPIVIQSIDSLKASIRSMSVSSLQRINLTQEWSDIERLVNSGITPSAERLKEYLAASCFKGSLDSDMERIVSCISDILRMQEETCCATDPALKDILVVLGSGRSGQELKLAFAN